MYNVCSEKAQITLTSFILLLLERVIYTLQLKRDQTKEKCFSTEPDQQFHLWPVSVLLELYICPTNMT